MVIIPYGPLCPSCRYPVREYWRYCPICGRVLRANSEAGSARNQPKAGGNGPCAVFPALRRETSPLRSSANPGFPMRVEHFEFPQI